ncbi:MAG: PQQ-binding-like beta-propeller repeat protein [Bacteroidetes bacterium]|nr:PQQ-binding-like beta-propeller repeat protein [Bacteroidota bacterium]
MKSVFFTVFILLSFAVLSQNWSSVGGNNQRNGVTKYNAPLILDDNKLWEVTDANYSVFGNAVYSWNDRFITTRVRFSPVYSGVVECRSLYTGSLLWEQELYETSILYCVGMNEDAAYVHDYSSDTLYALNITDGSVKWRGEIKSQSFGGAHNILFACNGDPVLNGPNGYNPSMIRLDKDDGSLVWTNENFVSIMPSADYCLYNETIYKWEGTITTAIKLLAVDARTGETLYYSDALPGDGDQEGPLTVSPDGTIYGQRDGGDLFAFRDNGSGFDILWTYALVSGGPGTYGNIGFDAENNPILTDSNRVVKLSKNNGSILFSSPALQAEPVADHRITVDASGNIMVSNAEPAGGRYWMISPDFQEIIWELPLSYNYYCGPNLNHEGIMVFTKVGYGIEAYQGLVDNGPVADFVASERVIYEGESVDFTNLSSFTQDAWSWEFDGADPSVSTVQNPTGIEYHYPGLYNVSLAVSGTDGSDTLMKECYIEVIPAVGFPERAEKSAITVFPNPVRDQLGIRFAQNIPMDFTVTLLDLSGREVLSIENISGNPVNWISLPGTISNGLFFLKLDAEGQSALIKVLVER